MSKFQSQENKAMLWNLFLEDKIIQPQNVHEMQQIQDIFEKICTSIDQKQTSNTLEKNKMCIQGMITIMKQSKETETIQATSPQTQPYSKEDITKLRSEAMNKKFEGKQQEFSNLIHAKRPQEIDFTDKSEEDDVIKNFQIERTMDSREKELERIMNENQTEQQKKQAEDWISNSAGKPITDTKSKTTGPPKLEIKELVEEKNEVIDLQPKKRVTFENNTPSSLQTNFLSKLKVKNIDNGNDNDETRATPRIDDIYKIVQQLQSDVATLQQQFTK